MHRNERRDDDITQLVQDVLPRVRMTLALVGTGVTDVRLRHLTDFLSEFQETLRRSVRGILMTRDVLIDEFEFVHDIGFPFREITRPSSSTTAPQNVHLPHSPGRTRAYGAGGSSDRATGGNRVSIHARAFPALP